MRTLAEPPTYSIASFPAPSPHVNNLTFLLSLTDMSAKAIADKFLSRLSGSVSTRTQLIDANQAMKLACTLNRRIAADVEIDTEPPKGMRELTFFCQRSVWKRKELMLSCVVLCGDP